MKTDNKQLTEIDVQKWWGTLGLPQAQVLRQKYFPDYMLIDKGQMAYIYLSEHPQSKEQSKEETVKGKEVDNLFTGVEIKLWVTGSGNRENLTDNDVLLRTDDATIHLDKDSEFGKLAHAMIDRYNNHDKLVSALKEAMEDLKNLACNYADYSFQEDHKFYYGKLASYANAKALLTTIDNK